MKKTILVLDDETIIGHLLENFLSAQYEVKFIDNGQQALEWLELNIPDLIIADIEMPGMNGLELLRRLRQEPRWQQLSVVMLTAHEAGPVSQQALDMGAQAYLTKPYSPQQLLAQVKRYAAAAVD